MYQFEPFLFFGVEGLVCFQKLPDLFIIDNIGVKPAKVICVLFRQFHQRGAQAHPLLRQTRGHLQKRPVR